MKHVVTASILILAFTFSFGALAQTNDTSHTTYSGPANNATMANQAGNSQSGAQGAAIAMAALMAMMCNQPQGNVMPCILSALAAMQAGSLGGTSAGAYNNALQYSTAAGAKPTPPPTGAPGSGADISGIKQTLLNNGAKISSDGTKMTLPDGQTVALNPSLATDSGAAAAGFSAQQIAQGKAAIAEAQAQLGGKAKSQEMAADGGGGGSSSAAGAAPPGVAAKGYKRGGKTLSGLSKNFGSDKIGVAADNIFEMITRRYKAKEAQNSFITN